MRVQFLLNCLDLLAEMLVEFLAVIEKAFKPHATVLKLSKLYGPVKRKVGVEKLYFGWLCNI